MTKSVNDNDDNDGDFIQTGNSAVDIAAGIQAQAEKDLLERMSEQDKLRQQTQQQLRRERLQKHQIHQQQHQWETKPVMDDVFTEVLLQWIIILIPLGLAIYYFMIKKTKPKKSF